MDTPRIYVASLADYNAGHLHGVWIDIDPDVETMQEQIDEMLAKSKQEIAEEYAIHDLDDLSWSGIGEYSPLSDVAKVAELLENSHDSDVVKVAFSLADGIEYVENMIENFAGVADSLEDWAREYLESTGELNSIPENLRNYFDFQSYARDLELGGGVCTTRHNGDTYIFYNN